MQQLLKYPEKTPENSHYLRWYDLRHWRAGNPSLEHFL